MKRILFFAIALAASIACRAQIINTFAGDSTQGYMGDGGAATATDLFYPTAVAVDGSGNVYIVDKNNSRIRKVNTSGIISTFAGNGTPGFSGDSGAATAAELNYPSDLAFDGTGNMYIADWGNDRVRKVDTSGIITTLAELNSPTGVAADGIGNVYIAENGTSQIRKVDTSGIIYLIAGNGTPGYGGDGGAATAAKLDAPWGVSVDGKGNVYIGDNNNSRIRRVDTSGIITTFAGNGTPGYSGDGMAATATELDLPTGAVVDSTGNVYIVDDGNNRIRKIDTSGIITTIAGNGATGYSGDGGAATAAELNNPRGVAVDGSGNVYIADLTNNRIRKVSCCPLDVTNIYGQVEAIKVFPDPADDMLHIQSPVIISHVAIFDLAGQRVFETDGGADAVDLNIERLCMGTYLLQVNGVWVQRFVKW